MQDNTKDSFGFSFSKLGLSILAFLFKLSFIQNSYTCTHLLWYLRSVVCVVISVQNTYCVLNLIINVTMREVITMLWPPLNMLSTREQMTCKRPQTTHQLLPDLSAANRRNINKDLQDLPIWTHHSTSLTVPIQVTNIYMCYPSYRKRRWFILFMNILFHPDWS